MPQLSPPRPIAKNLEVLAREDNPIPKRALMEQFYGIIEIVAVDQICDGQDAIKQEKRMEKENKRKKNRIEIRLKQQTRFKLFTKMIVELREYQN